MRSTITALLLACGAVAVGTLAAPAAAATRLDVLPFRGNGHGKPESNNYDSVIACTAYNSMLVRAGGYLNRQTGELYIAINLESDHVTKGPKAVARITVRDAALRPLADITSAEVSRGGKMGRHAKSSTFTQSLMLDRGLAAQATYVDVVPQCTGTEDTLNQFLTVVKAGIILVVNRPTE